MSSAKLAAGSALAAIALAGCGSAATPVAGNPGRARVPVTRGRIDDPRTSQSNRVKCLRQHGLAVQEVGNTGLQIGAPPGGPMVQFAPTPGAAQGDQIEGRNGGAEVIGAALLYPNQGPDDELKTIEGCLSKGVKG